MVLGRHNVLVLDEPTNHLDIESIEGLLEGLLKFEGTVLFVSHDHHFVSRLATRIVELSRPRRRRHGRGLRRRRVQRHYEEFLEREDKRRASGLSALLPVDVGLAAALLAGLAEGQARRA